MKNMKQFPRDNKGKLDFIAYARFTEEERVEVESTLEATGSWEERRSFTQYKEFCEQEKQNHARLKRDVERQESLAGANRKTIFSKFRSLFK